jgi:hypothetical protein
MQETATFRFLILVTKQSDTQDLAVMHCCNVVTQVHIKCQGALGWGVHELELVLYITLQAVHHVGWFVTLCLHIEGWCSLNQDIHRHHVLLFNLCIIKGGITYEPVCSIARLCKSCAQPTRLILANLSCAKTSHNIFHISTFQSEYVKTDIS